MPPTPETPPIPKQEIRRQYEELTHLEQQFAHAFSTRNHTHATTLQQEIDNKKNALMEIVNPFERLIDLGHQYEQQTEILRKLGILKFLSDGQRGITDIHGKEHTYPSYREIITRMRAQKDIFIPKIDQGFTTLLITPFGMKLDDLIEIYRHGIITHYQEGKLFYTRQNPADEHEPLIPVLLHADYATNPDNAPLHVWDGYHNADIDGKLLYDVKAFSPDPTKHQGKTKAQILTDTRRGFHISLIENLPNIPRSGNGHLIHGRPQLEAGKTPRDYLSLLGTPPYDHEIGMTPEDHLIYALYHLATTNQVIDDVNGHGSISYNIGAYFPFSGAVPGACWHRVGRRAYVYRRHPDSPVEFCGVRSVVRVSL